MRVAATPVGATPTAPPPPALEDDVFKILISTDNHLVRRVGGRACAWSERDREKKENDLTLFHMTSLFSPPKGVHEKDDVRKDDSFASFEEMLGLAGTHAADAVLLGGDLFHENKPSREAVVRAMGALSAACLVGEGEAEGAAAGAGVRFHVISPDPGAGLAAGAPNFTAPGHRVRLPVFSIHGNHDDPVGPGLLSAVDVLSSAGLVNYFGKRSLEGSTAGTVVMSPILLQKVRQE